MNRGTQVAAAVLLAAALFLEGCSEGWFGTERANEPPDTFISQAPAPGDSSVFFVEMRWYGWDPDGEVAGFRLAWDDTSSWGFTTASDSVFEVASTRCTRCDHTDTLYYDYHTFWIKAVDNQGAEDPTPALRTLCTQSIAPQTTLLRGPCERGYCGATGHNLLFEWTAVDPDGGAIDSFFFKLNVAEGMRAKVDSTWTRVGADCTHVVFTEVARTVTVTGRYNTFAVVAKDQSGALERVLSHGRNWCCFDPLLDMGPEIRVDGGVLGIRNTGAAGGPTSVGQVSEAFRGVPIAFSWSADASAYGGRVTGYRFAYEDTLEWSSWHLDTVREPQGERTFMPAVGNHVFYVQAVDDMGAVTVCPFKFYVENGPTSEGTMPLLIVDDSAFSGQSESAGRWQSWRADEVEDDFFERIFRGYDYLEWDCLEQGRQVPSTSLVGRFRTVFWYTDRYDLSRSYLYYLFHGGSRYLDAYVRVGGNLILSGETPAMSLDPDFRGIHRYPYHYDERYLLPGETVPISWWAFGLRTLGWLPHEGFRGAVSLVPGRFPDLPLGEWWPFITGTDTTYLSAVEVFKEDGTNPGVNAIPLYAVDCWVPPGADSAETCHSPYCALMVDRSGDPTVGSTAYFGWPLVWCDWDSVAVVMREILTGICNEPPTH